MTANLADLVYPMFDIPITSTFGLFKNGTAKKGKKRIIKFVPPYGRQFYYQLQDIISPIATDK